MSFYHELAYCGHFGPRKTAEKVLQSGSIGPLCSKMPLNFARCALDSNIRKDLEEKYDAPQLNFRIEIFNVWDIDFMGPFPNSFRNQYILVVVDYVSKWVKAILSKTKDNKVVIKFLKENIFSCFRTPRAIISVMALTFIIDPLKLLCKSIP